MILQFRRYKGKNMKTFRYVAYPATVSAALIFSSCTIGGVDDESTAAVPPANVASHSDDQPDAERPAPSPVSSAVGLSSTPDSLSGALTALKGKTIYLDPGHAGTAPPAELTADDGRGGVKSCNTSGTASDDGWPEHTFTWEIAGQLRGILESAGATVIMSRPDDTGRADCIDERTVKENSSAADAVVSIHADGSTAGNNGFHISSISDPLPMNRPEESARLAADVRNAMVNYGFHPSNYLGDKGLYPRADLTGLNLSSKPKILIEFGNMRDPEDLAALRSPDGRQQRAGAVAQGLADYLS